LTIASIVNTLSNLRARSQARQRSHPPQPGSTAEIRRQVLRLAIPAAGEQMLSMMVGIVDTYLVGHLSAASLAAVGLATQWVFMAITLFIAVSTGSTALVARAIGARDASTVQRVVRQSVSLGVLMGCAATLLVQLFAQPAIAIMGAEQETLHLGVTYLRIAACVFPLSALMFIGNACLRGAGDTRTPLYIMLVVNFINVAVAWALINGPFGLPRLGVAGSALGAVAGRTVGGILALLILLRGRGGLRLRLQPLRLEGDIIRRILRVGLPAGMERLLFRLGYMSFVRVVASLGTAAYAAHQIALNGESLSFMPGFGFAIAGTTLVGQGLGAQDPERAECSGYMAYRLGATLMGIMGIIFFIFAKPIIGFFSNDPQVVQLGITPLRIVGLVQPFLAAAMIFAGNLRGAGDTKVPMLITTFGVWGIRVPLATLLALHLGWGLTGAWVAMSIDFSTRGLLNFLRFRSGTWKRTRV